MEFGIKHVASFTHKYERFEPVESRLYYTTSSHDYKENSQLDNFEQPIEVSQAEKMSYSSSLNDSIDMFDDSFGNACNINDGKQQIVVQHQNYAEKIKFSTSCNALKILGLHKR